jgi:hypothetical protein
LSAPPRNDPEFWLIFAGLLLFGLLCLSVGILIIASQNV